MNRRGWFVKLGSCVMVVSLGALAGADPPKDEKAKAGLCCEVKGQACCKEKRTCCEGKDKSVGLAKASSCVKAGCCSQEKMACGGKDGKTNGQAKACGKSCCVRQEKACAVAQEKSCCAGKRKGACAGKTCEKDRAEAKAFGQRGAKTGSPAPASSPEPSE
jgi:hypothetical protein